MDEPAVRQHAQAFCEALVAGDVDRAIADLSDELRRNLGEVLALLPLPATAATIQSVEAGGAGYNVIIRLVGESDEVEIQTRWKDRDGEPRIVETSHLSRTVRVAQDAEAEAEAGTEGQAGGSAQ
ncbi:MAG TPA: hypothetical protein VEX41_11110 [Candidatus Eisenbacteria bacterium]|nr:hypothetical protein [Candidatus Eisenbacteria bacterium]